eukprot:COSAG01_NODE_2666_length_7293_cov_6.078592_3_plen_137_part_00
MGHSAGGQTVQRYALVTGSDTPALHTRFVVANPSSFGYLNASRWADTSNPTILHQPDAALCPTYNQWVRLSARLPACALAWDRCPLYVPVKDVCGWCGRPDVSITVSAAGSRRSSRQPCDRTGRPGCLRSTTSGAY